MTIIVGALLLAVAPQAVVAQTHSVAEQHCSSADAKTASRDVITYCTRTYNEYGHIAQESKSAAYRDRVKISMATLAVKIAVAHKVAGDGQQDKWITGAKRLLTDVSNHGASADDRALAKKYLDPLEAAHKESAV